MVTNPEKIRRALTDSFVGSTAFKQYHIHDFAPLIPPGDLERLAQFFRIPSQIKALVTATQGLGKADLEEVTLYALFRRYAKQDRRNEHQSISKQRAWGCKLLALVS